jgi:hypothetical protein
MSQPARGPAPIGVVYNTSMSRPDAALALAVLHVSGSRRESRIGAVCVTGAGLGAAVFCDLVATFYASGTRLPNSNQALPIGLAAVSPLPPDPPMVNAAIDRKRENGEPFFARTVRRVSDTALAAAVLRNGVSFNASTIVVLSAPATALAASLDLPGARDIYQQRIKRLVVVESDDVASDQKALRKVLNEWPSPIVLAGRDVGASLAVTSAVVDKMLAWAPAHPVADAYRAFKVMPYDAPSDDLAAVHYAVYPSSGFFEVADVGSVSMGGSVMSVRAGTVSRLSVHSPRKAEATVALIDLASAKPAPPPQGRRGSSE